MKELDDNTGTPDFFTRRIRKQLANIALDVQYKAAPPIKIDEIEISNDRNILSTFTES